MIALAFLLSSITLFDHTSHLFVSSRRSRCPTKQRSITSNINYRKSSQNAYSVSSASPPGSSSPSPANHNTRTLPRTRSQLSVARRGETITGQNTIFGNAAGNIISKWEAMDCPRTESRSKRSPRSRPRTGMSTGPGLQNNIVDAIFGPKATTRGIVSRKGHDDIAVYSVSQTDSPPNSAISHVSQHSTFTLFLSKKEEREKDRKRSKQIAKKEWKSLQALVMNKDDDESRPNTANNEKNGNSNWAEPKHCPVSNLMKQKWKEEKVKLQKYTETMNRQLNNIEQMKSLLFLRIATLPKMSEECYETKGDDFENEGHGVSKEDMIEAVLTNASIGMHFDMKGIRPDQLAERKVKFKRVIRPVIDKLIEDNVLIMNGFKQTEYYNKKYKVPVYKLRAYATYDHVKKQDPKSVLFDFEELVRDVNENPFVYSY